MNAILVEVVLVFGGAIAFGWWQLRDVRRAERETAAQRAHERASQTAEPAEQADPVGDPDALKPRTAPADDSNQTRI